jgi:sacsin
MGYKCPSICIEDGPFIDEVFYGSEIVSFKDALARIGVIVDIGCGQDLVAKHLISHKDMSSISRIYMYLMEYGWEPQNKNSNWIWIPNGESGQ